MLIKMLDGGVKDILEDRNSSSGCETCDYGSSYVNEISFILTSGTFTIISDTMYDYALSDGQIMKIILPNISEINNMTELEFVKWIEVEFDKEVQSDSLTYNFK